MTPETKRAARDATAAAEAMVASVEADYPDVWPRLDRMRASRGSSPDLDWPDWCLLPMGACAAVAQTRPEVLARRPSIIAEISAAYAWRYTRSVYLVEDHLQGRLLTQVPDALTLEDVTGLPEWCIAVASTHPEWPGISLWVHLEWDTRNRRPELRLLLSHTDPPVAVPVYLDRPTLTEALADMTATTRESVYRPGANVRGAPLPSGAGPALVDLAEHVDKLIGLVAYLARPEADIVHASRPGVRPVKPRRPKRDADVWLVGFS